MFSPLKCTSSSIDFRLGGVTFEPDEEAIERTHLHEAEHLPLGCSKRSTACSYLYIVRKLKVEFSVKIRTRSRKAETLEHCVKE